ncbi:amidohydrolase family protein [Phenylobacterium sp. LjRoot219]|uniref:N-acyl-D-amino-acid deacylase family protein n=1 Tax=Phenylobacterium sp. LjRoot219 TaxID=3342283 RepID=UPI003ECC59B6
MADFDLVIRNGLICDGGGGEVFRGDIAVGDGVIRAVGSVEGKGRQEIDASGALVTPGFVDIHTHYDGQVTWEQRLKPSSEHGVTTVVMGNCGVGFAPCKPEERRLLEKVMEGVEDIPEIVITEGLPWAWRTFPEYLDFVADRRFDADCAAYIPHAAIRVYVMGDRGARREPSTPEDRRQMRALVAEAVRAGAIGVSTSRSLAHRDADGATAPHVQAAEAEMLALAEGLRDAGGGVFQVAAGLTGQQLKGVIPEAGGITPQEAVRREIALYQQICRTSGRPLTFSLSEVNEAPEMCRQALDLVAEANLEPGVTLMAQVFPRPIGLLFGLDLSLNPFKLHPAYQAIEHLPLAERVAEMRKPEVRAAILAEAADPAHPNPIHRFLVERSLQAFPFAERIDYEPDRATSLPAIAAREGRSIAECAYDALLQRDGAAILFLPINNYAHGSLDSIREMLVDANTFVGLGDGGAHYGFICDASYPTFLLSYWTRDRTKGERLDLTWAVHRLSRRNALAVGLADRGLLALGLKADINIIDYDRLQLGGPEPAFDLPAGGRRLTQKADGIVATIVAGEVTYRAGRSTGALPGRLVRAVANEAQQEATTTEGAR